MSKKILVTGGAGFIGSNLVVQLVKQGYFVRVLDNLNPQVHGLNKNTSYTYQLIKDKVEFIQGDILSKSDVSVALKDIDVLIHMAAETGTGQSMYDITLHTNSNINGLANIYEQIIKDKVDLKLIILPSSRSVYGEGKYLCSSHGHKYPTYREQVNIERNKYEFYCDECGMQLEPIATDENSNINLRSVYAYTKYGQEQLAKLMCEYRNIPTLIFRLQNVYGVGQSLNNPYTGIISIFSNLIKNEKNINVFEDGEESRDFVNVYDVARFISAFIKIENNGCNIYNIGSGKRVSVLKVINIISDLMNKNPKYTISGQYRIGDIRHNYANIDKLKNKIKIEPSIPLISGIKELLKWVEIEGNTSVNEQYNNSINELKKFGLYK